MCQDCGCSQPSPYQVGRKNQPASAHSHGHHHDHGHSHTHVLPDGRVITHTHSHDHEASPARHHHHHAPELGHAERHHQEHESSSQEKHQTLALKSDILSGNDQFAATNRDLFQSLGLLAINVVSSPGSGKTTLLQKTIMALAGRIRSAVVVGDLATENDAARLRVTGAPVIPITTGTMCHLEAAMVAQAINQLDLKGLDLLIIENVGNLVCPASFDLGEALRIVLLSVTEGEDKPLKYPPMFHSADVVIVTKTDLAEPAGFDREQALKNIRQASPRAQIFEVSARNGAGLVTWCDYLVAAKAKSSSVSKR
ncbi:MAG TPA: hydrogenase nickel incorporation protein HypB [Verrucomicrobiae bacterium]